MDLKRVRVGLILACLAVLLLLLPTAPTHAENTPPGWSAVRDSIDHFQRLPHGRERTHTLYEILDAVERRRIRITRDDEADSLVQFLATLLTPAEDKILRLRILEFLTSHPHPGAADSLWSLTLSGAGGSVFDGMAAPRILADMGDRRIIPWLIERLIDGSAPVIELLAVVADSLDVHQVPCSVSHGPNEHRPRGLCGAARAAEMGSRCLR